MSWRALLAMVQHAPRESALYRAMFGVDAMWGSLEHLVATLVDVQQLALWMKTKDAESGKNRPKPIPRPGVDEAGDGEQLGSGAIPMDEWDAWWAAEAPGNDNN